MRFTDQSAYSTAVFFLYSGVAAPLLRPHKGQSKHA